MKFDNTKKYTERALVANSEIWTTIGGAAPYAAFATILVAIKMHQSLKLSAFETVAIATAVFLAVNVISRIATMLANCFVDKCLTDKVNNSNEILAGETVGSGTLNSEGTDVPSSSTPLISPELTTQYSQERHKRLKNIEPISGTLMAGSAALIGFIVDSVESLNKNPSEELSR